MKKFFIAIIAILLGLILCSCNYQKSFVQQKTTLEGEGKQLNRLSLSTNGKLLAVSSRILSNSGVNGLIEVWDVEKKQIRHSLQINSEAIYLIDFLPQNSNRILLANKQGSIYLWHLEKESFFETVYRDEKQQMINPVIISIEPQEFILSNDGQFLAMEKNKNSIILLNLESKETKKLNLNKDSQQRWLSLSFSTDNRFLVASSTKRYKEPLIEFNDWKQNKVESNINIWNLENNQLVSSYKRKGTSQVKFISNSYDLIIASYSKEKSLVEVWDILADKQKQSFPLKDEIQIVSFTTSPDNRFLIVGYRWPDWWQTLHGEIKLWDLTLKKELETIKGLGDVWSVNEDMIFFPDSRTFASLEGNTIKLWKINK
ncbi:hypothetical protein VKI21_15745 [Cyanobacterium aponinum UTEX 3222]|uniref:WD40 repeat domain-containing protein n=1 Tax=Cyanobacterium aponinum TaxID=379064 RepID=UPI002B4C0847|nr:hypothetical protein [Cyanobacterium aponinum]WRL38034.1 hypothetical protein VKI22_15640 [Cyanobacterium aponinum UTEX 3221]WRL41484.1 hypothetical protein VKI21_15745 [Cyanobacterium aponinum UTEX 3222]